MDASLAGAIAIGAGAVSIGAVVWCALLARRLRRVREAQRVVLGDGPGRDLVEHAGQLDRQLVALGRQVEETVARLDARDSDLHARLEGAVAHCAVVRYDAMGEMSGQQSSSVALLDSHRSGVVMSSILHREQARLYAKQIVNGRSEHELSPEEEQALAVAMGTRPRD